jgi:hypothetical protein
MIRTVDGSLMGHLLLTTFLGSGRGLLVVFPCAGGALLANGLLRGGSNTATAITVDLAASFFDLLEAIGERNLQAVYGGASEIGGSFLPVDLQVSAISGFAWEDRRSLTLPSGRRLR